MWMCGHQPVLNWHTGLLTKLVRSQQLGADFFFHNLDLLEEKGAMSVALPVNPGTVKQVRLVAGIDKKKTFAHGRIAVSDTYIHELGSGIDTLAGGRLPKVLVEQARSRISLLTELLPPGTVVNSVATLSQTLMGLALQGLGLGMPNVLLLSEMLVTPAWQRVVEEAVQVFGADQFWELDSEGGRQQACAGLLALALTQGRLVPKALPLLWCQRRLGYSLVAGLGQAKYEAVSPVAMPETRTVYVSSKQGLPDEWQGRAPEGFRPSALLLWLLGGQYDSSYEVSE